MDNPALSPDPLTRTALRLAPRAVFLLVTGAALAGASLAVSSALIGLVLLTVGVTLVALSGIVRVLSTRHELSQRALFENVASFVENDASPSFTTDAEGVIGYQNKAAIERFGGRDGETLLAALGDTFASPSATLFRLQNRAMAKGAAREDVVMRRGHLRLSVHQIGAEGFLWRLEDIADRAGAGRGADGISLPMLTASRTGTVLYMNEAMRRLLGGRQGTLDRIITDLPLRPNDLHSIAGVDGPVEALVAEIASSGGRRELYFVPADKPAMSGDWDMLEALPVPLMKIAQDGVILMSNRPARALLAIDDDAPQRIADLVEGLGRPVADWIEAAAAARTATKPEVLRATQQSQETYIQMTLSPVAEADETALIAVLNDATELKTLEAQFVQSQKMQAIGQLAGGVAHDFNNLLTAISGHCDLLLLRHDEADQDYGDLVQIHQNANRAASLVGQLLAFSRKQTMKPETVDLRDALSDLTHLLNRLVGEKISLTLNHDPDLKLIRADKRQLEQVVMNLVVNARDAMAEGGEITVETANEALTEPYQRDRVAVPPGDYVVLRVRDEGAGIPADKLPKVFEPFFTTKRTGEGTGLGLSTAYGIVKQSGGYIFADSVVGSGTCFTLFFPVHDKVEPETVEPAAAPVRPTHQRRGAGVVLLVEDEAPVRAFASRALRMRGYTVLEAENAEEALKTLEDNSLDVDVFVTDVIMPGMDGPSWVSKALEDRPGVKVVFVSGYAEDSFTDQQARIPNSVFLPKPFSLNELTATVQDQIH